SRSGPRKGNPVTPSEPAVADGRDPAAPLPTPVMLRDVPRTLLAVLLLMALIWAMMIVVATWPLMLKLQTRVRRRAVAVTVMSIGMLLVFFAPVVLMIDALAENTDTIAGWAHTAATAPIPLLPEWV